MIEFKVLWATIRDATIFGKVAVREGAALSVYHVSRTEGRAPRGVPWTGYFGQVDRSAVQAALPAIAAEMAETPPVADDHDAIMRADEAGFASMEAWYGTPIYPADSTACRSL